MIVFIQLKGTVNGQLLSPSHCFTMHTGNVSKVIKTKSLWKWVKIEMDLKPSRWHVYTAQLYYVSLMNEPRSVSWSTQFPVIAFSSIHEGHQSASINIFQTKAVGLLLVAELTWGYLIFALVFSSGSRLLPKWLKIWLILLLSLFWRYQNLSVSLWKLSRAYRQSIFNYLLHCIPRIQLVFIPVLSW